MLQKFEPRLIILHFDMQSYTGLYQEQIHKMKGSSTHNRDGAPMDITDSGTSVRGTSDMEEAE